MTLRQLNTDQFKTYPSQARDLATKYLDLLQQLPLAFLPILLREIIDYDWKFPVERSTLESQLTYLASLTPEQLTKTLSSFKRFAPPFQFEQSDLVGQPDQFEVRLTEWLWSTEQMDAFRAAAREYTETLRAANPEQPAALRRLGIVLIGQGVDHCSYPLFRKLRPHGVHFTNVSSANALAQIQQAVTARALSHPLSYGHWYIDGGQKMEGKWEGITTISYQALASMRAVLLKKIQTSIQSGEVGPEALREMLLEMQPSELGATEADPILNRFLVRVLTDGSGTQIFSTSFAQWAAREALRRAQPVTLLLRFAPRQRQRSMNEMLSDTAPAVAGELDPEGSLIDADMGAYYTWMNQQRLSGANQSSFLIWFEGHSEAVAIGPSMPRSNSSSALIGLDKILDLLE